MAYADLNDLLRSDGPDAVRERIDAAWAQGPYEPRPNGASDDLWMPPTEPDVRLHIRATPYTWTEPAKVPRRDWLWRHHLVRGFIAADVAPGGIGKTNFKIAQTLEMVAGRDLLDHGHRKQPLRVWLWNLEDPREEMIRRIQAAAKYYDITEADIGGRLFLDIGREQELVIADTGRDGAVIRRPVVDNIVAELQANEIDVLIIDPFVSSHHVGENDNNAIDMVAKEWAKVASLANCSVDLVHHTRKQGSVEPEVTTESSRGGKALTDACRSVVVFNKMTKQEAEKVGVENHRSYFRVFIDKANMAPPSDVSDWYRLETVDLCNGDLGDSDKIGVVVAWKWPDPMKDVTVADLRAAQKEVASGGPWRANIQAKDWVGIPISKAMKLDPKNNKSDRETVKGALSQWMKNGMFILVTGKDKNRDERAFVEVGTWATD